MFGLSSASARQSWVVASCFTPSASVSICQHLSADQHDRWIDKVWIQWTQWMTEWTEWMRNWRNDWALCNALGQSSSTWTTCQRMTVGRPSFQILVWDMAAAAEAFQRHSRMKALSFLLLPKRPKSWHMSTTFHAFPITTWLFLLAFSAEEVRTAWLVLIF